MVSWRERVLLSLLKSAPKKRATKIQLIKWLFLLKEEERIDRYGTFYDFLPYKHGPFSFLAYRDTAELEDKGVLRGSEKSLILTTIGRRVGTSTLQPAVRQSVARVLRRYGSVPHNELLRYVYENYPWYASKSATVRTRRTVVLKRPGPGLFTIGYEGLSIDAFLNAILKVPLANLADVRSNAVSRKYGFSKSGLEKKCNELGIRYCHYPKLGIPAATRKAVKDRDALWQIYRHEILPNATPFVRSLAALCTEGSSGLFCFEKDARQCHRSILAIKLSSRTKMPVYSYRSETATWERG